MKMRLFALLAVLTLAFAQAGRAQSGQSDITFQDFYDALSPYGDWLNVEGYGYCWHPKVDDNWAPYTDGSWAYTDAGWTWNGNEEWSWAPYHYGRWTQLPDWGWVWVPGYEWAPAWVSWRYGEDYVGWAPLPPNAVWIENTGFNSTVDVEYGIAPSYYSFCPIQYFGAAVLTPCILPYWNNEQCFARTKNATRLYRGGNAFICNVGPSFAWMNQRVERPFREARLERVAANQNNIRNGQARNNLQNGVLQVVAPSVVRTNARPQSVTAELSGAQSQRPPERISGQAVHHHQSQGYPVANSQPIATPPPMNNGAVLQPFESTQQGSQRPSRQANTPNRPNQVPPPVDLTNPSNGSQNQPGNVPIGANLQVSSEGNNGSIQPRPTTGSEQKQPHRLVPSQAPANPTPTQTQTGGLTPVNNQAIQQQIEARKRALAQQQAAQQQAAQQRAAEQAARRQYQQQQQTQPQYQPQQQQAPVQRVPQGTGTRLSPLPSNGQPQGNGSTHHHGGQH